MKIVITMSNLYPETEHIWDIAELLRGDYKRSDYGKVILPFTVLRRLDCILEPTKAEVMSSLTSYCASYMHVFVDHKG
jgi:type I restriction enzyme M protein